MALRKIDKIIVHCADTPDGKDFTIKDIDRNNLVYALYLKKPLLCGVGAFCCLNTFFR